MSGSILASLIFLLISLTLLQRCGAVLESRHCTRTAFMGVAYMMNLGQFLATLPSIVLKNRGYFNGSVGSMNAVFGTAMCHADMPWPDHCESCLQAATADAPQVCPAGNDASVMYRGCVLRYSNTPIVPAHSIVDEDFAIYLRQDRVANTTALNQTRADLFNDLISELVTSPLMIASGNRTFNSTHNLYGLAQCSRDLPKELCSLNILRALDHPRSAHDRGLEGASIIGDDVYIRYDLTPFQVYVPDNSSVPDDSSSPTETAKDVLRYKQCPSSGNLSTSSDAYQMNLRQFLDALPSNAIKNSGFFNDTKTGSENKVFGTAMCQADIPWPNQCKNCLQAASAGAPKACPASDSASVAYQGCVLRYSDMPILADADDEDSNSIAFYTQNHAASVPDTIAFQQTRQDLLTDLAGAAVISPMMIGLGNRTFNSSHKLYGLVQCNRDLPKELCYRYIKSVLQLVPDDLLWSEGVSITGFSFYIRYDLTPFAVYVPPTPPTGKGGLVRRVKTIVIPVSFSIIIFLVAFIVIRHYGKNQKLGHLQNVSDLKDFSFGDIKTATNNFDKDNLLGEGGFGKVYKGTFTIDHNTKELAIKCVANPSAAKQLKDELKILAKLEHKNVVQLVGFCNNDRGFCRGRGLYVCSELISNGPLDKKIFASSGQSIIEWPLRYQIVCGICAGLQYLHQDRNNILHMDLKPSNILLDEEMMPKIADFGLSRVLQNTKTHTYTQKVIGSNGYMAPEFLKYGKVGHKCDIYSLGVLILAIVMGEEPTAMLDPSGAIFINEVREKFTIDLEATTPKICSAKDPEQLKKDASLQDDDCIEDVEKCVGLAFSCVNKKTEDRPTAADIYNRLLPVIPSDNGVHVSSSEPSAEV